MKPETLFALTTENQELTPERIVVHPITNARLARLQPLMSSADWRPGKGRKISFQIELGWNGPLLGILQLASPVLSLGPRDKYLDLPSDKSERGVALRHVADMSVCIGAQPIAWHWNLGKLIAMIAPTFSDEWESAYGDKLRGIQTTSVYGRSSQYNKVMTLLGFTQGHGSAQMSDSEYRRIRRWLMDNGHEPPQDRLDRGRLGVLQWYEQKSGEKIVFHGRQRGIYWHDALLTSSRPTRIVEWYKRWGHPRYERTRELSPPYENATVPTKTYREAGK